MKTLFKIHQIKDIQSVKYAFRDYDFAANYGLSFADYAEVEHGELESKDFEGATYEETVINMLEYLFEKYNIGLEDYPRGMHSLSVSDIVQLNDTCYYCDFSGWKKM